MIGLGMWELIILAVIGATIFGVGLLVGAVIFVKLASKRQQ